MDESRDGVLQFIINLAARLFGKDASELGEDTSFTDDLHCKSANIVQFTTSLEDEYDIEVPYMEFNRKKTFGEAADYIADLCDF